MPVNKRNKKRKHEESSEDVTEEDVAMEEAESSGDENSSEEKEEEEETVDADNSDSEERAEAAQQDNSDSSEAEEESEQIKQDVVDSSDKSDSEEESAEVAQQDNSDSSESEEESAEAAQQDNSDSSESEEEENVPDVKIKQEVASSSSANSSESEEESAPVEETQQDGSDSSESEEESEAEKEEVKPRVAVMVKVPSEEPKKKKAKIETKEKVEEELGDEEIRTRAVRRMLESIPRNELVKIIANVSTQYDELYTDLKTAAGPRVAHRNVIVRGLALETRTKKMKSSFKSFGKIEDSAVMYDKSGKSRGFGFITFTEVEAAVRAVARKSIFIDGREVSCNFEFIRHDGPHGKTPGTKTTPGQVAQQKSQQEKQALYAKIYEETKDRKLFVSGLRQHIREETLHDVFKKFGDLEKVVVVLDRATKKSKGCAFITYREKAGADAALKTPPKKIDGRTILCNLASRGKKSNKKREGK